MSEPAMRLSDKKKQRLAEPSDGCGACQNLEAYWEERAKHDPDLRERMLRLERQNEEALRGVASGSEKES